MKKFLSLLFLSLCFTGFADEVKLPIQINVKKGIVTAYSDSALTIPVASIKAKHRGAIKLEGLISVENGPVSLIMWSKVDGNFYFSKMPNVQNLNKAKNLSFSIPFNAEKKLVEEVRLNVTFSPHSKISLSGLRVVTAK